jgi:hypothetical protein
MEQREIKEQQTYRSASGTLWYVESIEGRRVTFNVVGKTDRQEAALGRFAVLTHEQVPNK